MSKLPDLPPAKSGFWKHAVTSQNEVKPFTKCEHEFRATGSTPKCTKCNFGLIGPIQIKDGKLFYKGEQLPL